MIATNELKGRIVAKGFTQEQVAKELGISANTFRRKLSKGVLGSDEIEKLIKLLDIKDPMAIFLLTKSLVR